jgi:hypothetical protein
MSIFPLLTIFLFAAFAQNNKATPEDGLEELCALRSEVQIVVRGRLRGLRVHVLDVDVRVPGRRDRGLVMLAVARELAMAGARLIEPRDILVEVVHGVHASLRRRPEGHVTEVERITLLRIHEECREAELVVLDERDRVILAVLAVRVLHRVAGTVVGRPPVIGLTDPAPEEVGRWRRTGDLLVRVDVTLPPRAGIGAAGPAVILVRRLLEAVGARVPRVAHGRRAFLRRIERFGREPRAARAHWRDVKHLAVGHDVVETKAVGEMMIDTGT